MHFTWNSIIYTRPLLLYEDELTYDAERQGLVCKSGNASILPSWFNPNDTRVVASLWSNLRDPVRFYQSYYHGTSRLIFKDLKASYAQVPEISGLFTCRLRGHQSVAVGIYKRSINGKAADVR